MSGLLHKSPIRDTTFRQLPFKHNATDFWVKASVTAKDGPFTPTNFLNYIHIVSPCIHVCVFSVNPTSPKKKKRFLLGFKFKKNIASHWQHNSNKWSLRKLVHCSPASLVSTIKSVIWKVRPSTRPGPNTFTLLASPISDCTTMMEMGLLATWRPFFLMLTKCSPTSLGMKEIPGG